MTCCNLQCGVLSEFLTIQEAADFFSVKIATIRDWCRKGKIPFYRTPGGQIRFLKNTIEEIMSESFVGDAAERQMGK